MENEKKENKRPFVEDKGQIFYFNDKGQLVVESNKGIWVDGEKFVKMYGNFTCNAKTLGVIIQQLKGIKVDVEPEFEALLLEAREKFQKGTDDIEAMWKSNYEKKEKDWEVKSEILSNENLKLIKAIKRYNALPWWKRMFKKVEV